MLRSKIHEGIGYIILDRPEKRNAFNAELVEEIHRTVDAFNADANVRAIVLKANGEAFSAGADLAYLQQLQGNSLKENEEDSLALANMFTSLYNSPKLTFSWVDGYALAGGCGLATVTDFCYATPGSQFGYTEARIGFVPAIVLTYLGHKISGQAMNELLLTGKIIAAQEASSIDLISEVVEEDDFERACETRVRDILQNASSQSIAYTKQLMREVRTLPFEDAVKHAAKLNALARSSDDCVKGIDAFLNKQKIRWS